MNRLKRSEYMEWAKTQSRAKFNLATSGVGSFPLRELEFRAEELEINGDNSYGYRPLIEAIAAKEDVNPECVVTAAGTSFANFLAMASLIEPGDEVLVEQPTYELLLSTLEYLGANVKRFARKESDGYALDPAQVRKAWTPRTKLIVVTNLHNPSSALASDAALAEIGQMGTVLVDEVYLDAVYQSKPKSAIHLGPQFVVTNSLTKVYGVSGLRCGWILASPERARAMWRLNDLFAATPVHPGELLSFAALAQLDRLRERARRVVEADRRVLAAFLDEHPKLAGYRTKWGTTAFLRGEEAFVNRLRSEFETSVVPGRFFEMPDRFRVGMGVNHEMFAEGLKRIGLAAL